MSAIDSIKHLPRWTWYTAAGVSAGAIGIKLYKGRAAPKPTQQASGGGTVGDIESGSGVPMTTGGSPPGVIVPPIITGGDGVSASDLGAAFAGLVGGTISDLSGLVGTVVTGDQASMQQLIAQLGQQNNAAIDLIAGAGSPPQPVQVNPTPVIVNVPPPAPAPVAAPPRAPTPAAPASVTIDGKVFPGAISHHIGVPPGGTNAYGQYVIHIVVYPGGRQEKWWHYTRGQSAGKWTGPH